MTLISRRSSLIQPFHVMRLLARARQLEGQGRDIVHMEVGEPDFATPQPVIDAAQKAIARGDMHYTPATGLPLLKQKLSTHYKKTYSVDIDPERIIITPGSSGALLLSLACVLEPGRKILLADPGYPCNRNFSYFLNGEVIPVQVDASTNYQLTAELIEQNWDKDTVGVVLASPSNPTGTLIASEELKDIVQVVEKNAGRIFMDEIYHGLIYGNNQTETILNYTDHAFVINSFSKYYGMTGWRLGWCVVPEEFITVVDNFAQNIFLAPSTPSQYAALVVFEPETQAILEQHRQAFQQRRDFLLPAVQQLGFQVKSEPQGAFYIYSDSSSLTDDSDVFSEQLLEQAGVAITPGMDFGTYRSKQHVRFAYTTSLERLQEGIDRIAKFLDSSF